MLSQVEYIHMEKDWCDLCMHRYLSKLTTGITSSLVRRTYARNVTQVDTSSKWRRSFKKMGRVAKAAPFPMTRNGSIDGSVTRLTPSQSQDSSAHGLMLATSPPIIPTAETATQLTAQVQGDLVLCPIKTKVDSVNSNAESDKVDLQKRSQRPQTNGVLQANWNSPRNKDSVEVNGQQAPTGSTGLARCFREQITELESKLVRNCCECVDSSETVQRLREHVMILENRLVKKEEECADKESRRLFLE